MLGVGLILFAVFGIGYLAPPVQLTNVTTQGLAVNANRLGYIQLGLNQSGAIVIAFNSSRAIDFYFTNAATFAALNTLKPVNNSFRAQLVALEGKGVYEVYLNASSGAFPYINIQNISKPAYIQPNLTAFQAGSYYAVFANLGNSTAQIGAKSLPITLAKLQSTFGPLSGYFATAFILFIAGIVVILFGIFSKGGRKQQPMPTDQDAEKEFDKLAKEEKHTNVGSGKRGKKA